MAKTIKFNLNCDGKPVRTIEELQENFSLDDILAHYNSGKLQKWLEMRHYEIELEAVNAISTTDVAEIVKSLVKIFEVMVDEDTIEDFVAEYKFSITENGGKIMQEQPITLSVKLKDYFDEYETVINEIIKAGTDTSVIKICLKKIIKEYMPIFEKDYRRLFHLFLQSSPIAIFCMLSNETMRPYYIIDGETVYKILNEELGNEYMGYYCGDTIADLYDFLIEICDYEDIGEKLISESINFNILFNIQDKLSMMRMIYDWIEEIFNSGDFSVLGNNIYSAELKHYEEFSTCLNEKYILLYSDKDLNITNDYEEELEYESYYWWVKAPFPIFSSCKPNAYEETIIYMKI